MNYLVKNFYSTISIRSKRLGNFRLFTVYSSLFEDTKHSQQNFVITNTIGIIHVHSFDISHESYANHVLLSDNDFICTEQKDNVYFIIDT